MAKQRRCGKGSSCGYNHSSDKEKKRKPAQNKEPKCYQCSKIRHLSQLPELQALQQEQSCHITMSDTNNN
jgi:hypothetical protein